MKYLKYRNQFLNEAFSAKSLSKTLGWLSKSGLKPTPFIEDLKEFCEKYKIQLSNIEDNFFKVNVRRSEALKLRSDEVNNPTGLWCIKFWFSATEGYKGYTVTPSKEKEKEAIKPKKAGNNDPFTKSDIEELVRIAKHDFMKTGELKPVVDYNELKTGDIIAFVDGNYNTLWGKIFCSHYDDGTYLGKYVINSRLTGNSPNGWYDENGNDLGYKFENTDIFEDFVSEDNFGSWYIYGSEPGNDHRKLHLYKKGDEPLHVVGDKKEEEDTSAFNLSISLYYNELYQIDNNNDRVSITKKDFDNSDFAIIFYLDEFLPHQEEDLSDVRKRRSDSKEGAIALMDDEEIKRINVKNRIEELIKRFNLSQDINNMTNLNLILLNMLRDDWSLFTLFNGYNNSIFYRIYDFFQVVDNQGRYSTDEEFKMRLDSRLEEVRNEYRSLLNSKLSKSKSFKEVYDKLIQSSNELLVDFLKNFMRLSIKLKDKIRSKNLSSLYDAQILMDKIYMISNPTNDSFRLPYDIREGLDYFSNEENATYYLNRLANDEKMRLDRAMMFMERQIDQL